MPELRKDPLTGSWIIISPERRIRPQYFSETGENKLTPKNCPFCQGNESMTPPEVYAIRNKNSQPNQPGWDLRVVPNKYPALRVEGTPDKKADGFYDKMNGVGAHEVVIETPAHEKDMNELTTDQVTEIFLSFKRRILDLKRDIRFKYIQVFKNHLRLAGATIPHPHSQIIALPVVPARLIEIAASAEAHFQNKERCLFCDIIHNEQEYHKRVLLENNEFIVIAPYAPKLPFELAIYPKHHHAAYEYSDDALLRSMAAVIRDTMARLNKTLKQPAYNLVLNNAPFAADNERYFHWHWELIPIISGTGGYELGTYSYINPTPPEEAIKILNSIG